jgi:hypothetical protein
MKTKDDLMEEVKKELSDAIESAKNPKLPNPIEEQVELRVVDTVPEEAGDISFTTAEGEKRFDGILKGTELSSVEAIAEAIEKATAMVAKEGVLDGKSGETPAGTSEG